MTEEIQEIQELRDKAVKLIEHSYQREDIYIVRRKWLMEFEEAIRKLDKKLRSIGGLNEYNNWKSMDFS